MPKFRPEIDVYSALYATIMDGSKKRSFDLRYAYVRLGLNFQATCSISVIADRSKNQKKINVTKSLNDLNNAFYDRSAVNVYVVVNGSTKLIFSGFVSGVSRAASSTASAFSSDLEVNLVSAPVVYAGECAELIGAYALDAEGTSGNSKYSTFVSYTHNMEKFGKAKLNKYKNSAGGKASGAGGFDLIPFLCDCIEEMFKATADLYTSNSGARSGKPQYTDLRNFIDTTNTPKLAVLYGHQQLFGEHLADNILALLRGGSPVDALLNIAGTYGICFRPIMTGSQMMWQPIANLPMLKDNQDSITSGQVLGYTHMGSSVVLGKYLNIAAATDLGKTAAAEGNPTQVAQYIVFSAGRDNNGKLSLRKYEAGKDHAREIASLGATKIVQSPSWILKTFNLKEKPKLEDVIKAQVGYATALAKTAYGVGEMFNGKLALKMCPYSMFSHMDSIGNVFSLNIDSEAVAPGTLYGRLTELSYRVQSSKDIAVDLQLSFDCVRTEEENNILGIDASDLLYKI